MEQKNSKSLILAGEILRIMEKAYRGDITSILSAVQTIMPITSKPASQATDAEIEAVIKNIFNVNIVTDRHIVEFMSLLQKAVEASEQQTPLEMPSDDVENVFASFTEISLE